MAKVKEALLVTKTVITKNGAKIDENDVSVEFSEWAAKYKIQEESSYYEGSAFDYAREILENGVRYTNVKEDEDVKFVYKKCLIVTGA